ncbi:MAG: efflux RND transporter periplasmic adaptor subunit [Planctomycetota bacterium]|nr:efflux RND transporter periplasmic adaptor subunit [Planctomycetota bacterium]
MQQPRPRPWVPVGLALALALAACTEQEAARSGPATGTRAVPVEVGAIERGPLTYRRTVSGGLQAAAEFVVAPKAGGRIVRLDVELGEPVARGQVVALLDSDELQQAVQQAEADLAVAQASHAEAKSAYLLAQRALKRYERLQAEGVTSEAQLDAGRADEVASLAHQAVTEANIARAQAALQTARIRLGYAEVTADWSADDPYRLVGERFVDEGSNVAANAPLYSVVQLDPIKAVVFVGERDYRLLRVGQEAELTADAYPGRSFQGVVARIAPVFQRTTRQARVELELANPDGRLKPGMFVRATLELAHVDAATSVPADALVERDGTSGVLVLEPDGTHVRWQPVEFGLRDGDRVQVLGELAASQVVTLGQELCDDGAEVHVVTASPLRPRQ